MPEIDEITPKLDAEDISPAAEIPIFSQSADSGGSVTLAKLIEALQLAVKDEDADFDTSVITHLTANTAVVANLAFPSTKKLTNLRAGSLALTLADTGAGSAQTVTATLAGAATDMFLTAALTSALPNGLILQGAWISAADTISFKVYNATGSTIAGASYTARVMAFSVGDYVPPA